MYRLSYHALAKLEVMCISAISLLVRFPPTIIPAEVMSTSTEIHEPDVRAGVDPPLKLTSSPVEVDASMFPFQSTNFILKTLPIKFVSSV